MLNHKKYTIPKDRKKSRTYLVVKCAAILNLTLKGSNIKIFLKKEREKAIEEDKN